MFEVLLITPHALCCRSSLSPPLQHKLQCPGANCRECSCCSGKNHCQHYSSDENMQRCSVLISACHVGGTCAHDATSSEGRAVGLLLVCFAWLPSYAWVKSEPMVSCPGKAAASRAVCVCNKCRMTSPCGVTFILFSSASVVRRTRLLAADRSNTRHELTVQAGTTWAATENILWGTLLSRAPLQSNYESPALRIDGLPCIDVNVISQNAIKPNSTIFKMCSSRKSTETSKFPRETINCIYRLNALILT